MAFQFRLEHEDGTPADPATLKAAVPDWRPGDTIPLGRGRLSASSRSGPEAIPTTTRCSWSNRPDSTPRHNHSTVLGRSRWPLRPTRSRPPGRQFRHRRLFDDDAALCLRRCLSAWRAHLAFVRTGIPRRGPCIPVLIDSQARV